MTIEEARTLIRGVEWRGSRPGLSRVRELLHRIGDPQDTLQFVHIAGTNGKGQHGGDARGRLAGGGLYDGAVHVPVSRAIRRTHAGQRPADPGRGSLLPRARRCSRALRPWTTSRRSLSS